MMHREILKANAIGPAGQAYNISFRMASRHSRIGDNDEKQMEHITGEMVLQL
jgi:hypothetical protein